MRWSSSQVLEEDDGSSSEVQMDVAAAPTHSSPPIPNNCPSCGHNIQELQLQNQLQQGGGIIRNLPSDLPSGVKFDPNDQEILEHLEAKLLLANHLHNNLHPLIHEFIPTLDGDNGICYTHPQKLPGVRKDGQVRHFFHRPSKAYTTGTRKRRKVHSDDEDGRSSETRWHKTGKTRPVVVNGTLKGFKKILVLYTNYGRQRKPEKTNWVMHQYHIGHSQDEKHGEMVLSKVFYQTQPRQQQSSSAPPPPQCHPNHPTTVVNYFRHNHHQHQHGGGEISSHVLPILGGGANSSLIRFATDSTNEERIS